MLMMSAVGVVSNREEVETGATVKHVSIETRTGGASTLNCAARKVQNPFDPTMILDATEVEA